MNGLITLAAALAAATGAADCDSPALQHKLKALLPDKVEYRVNPTPVSGLCEISAGLNVYYVTSDSEFVLGGPLIEIADGTNLTEERVAAARRELLEESTVAPYVFAADPARHAVTVITDVDCGYCRRAHKQMAEYNALGIAMHYLMMPRAGKGSESYRKTVSAVCTDDPQAAITAAMNGAIPAAKECENNIDAQMRLARELGATSTPNFVLPDGRLVAGWKKPRELLTLLESQQDAETR